MLRYFAFCLLVYWSYVTGTANSTTREYYIAAVERTWDYAPSGLNKIKGVSLDEDRYDMLFYLLNTKAWKLS